MLQALTEKIANGFLPFAKINHERADVILGLDFIVTPARQLEVSNVI